MSLEPASAAPSIKPPVSDSSFFNYFDKFFLTALRIFFSWIFSIFYYTPCQLFLDHFRSERNSFLALLLFFMWLHWVLQPPKFWWLWFFRNITLRILISRLSKQLSGNFRNKFQPIKARNGPFFQSSKRCR